MSTEDLEEISYSDLLLMNFTQNEPKKRNLKRKSNFINSSVNKKNKLNSNNSKINDKTKYVLSNIFSTLQEAFYNCKKCDIDCFNKFSHLLEFHQNESIECLYCDKIINVEDLKIHICKCVNSRNQNLHEPLYKHDENISVANDVHRDSTKSGECITNQEFRSLPAISSCDKSLKLDNNQIDNQTNEINSLISSEKDVVDEFRCEFCTKSFATNDNCSKHLNMLTGVVWTCSTCEEIFPSQICAESHSQINHPANCYQEPIQFDCGAHGLSLTQIHSYNVVKKMLKVNQSVQDTNRTMNCDKDNTPITNLVSEPEEVPNSAAIRVKSPIVCSDFQLSSKIKSRKQKTMENMANQFLSDKDSIVNDEFDNFAKTIEQSDICNMLSNENEQFLQNVLPSNQINNNNLDSILCTDNNESGVRVIDALSSLFENPKKQTDTSTELIVLATNKRMAIENELKNQEKIEQERKKEEKRITFQKLLVLDQIELKVSHLIQEYDSDSIDIMEDEDKLYNEDLSFINETNLCEDEINDILIINSARDTEKLHNISSNVTLLQYSPPNHIINKATVAQYDCHLCGEFFTISFNDFYIHLFNHYSKMILKKPKEDRKQCIICDVLIPGKEFFNHFKMHKTHVRCSICKEFVIENNLESHYFDHNKHYKCQICGEIYKTIGGIRKHTSHHFTGFTYSCEICGANFAGLEKLVSHINSEHKNIDPYFAECIYCFELVDNIKNHIYSTGLCKLKCKTCLKVYKTDTELIAHLKTHEEIQIPTKIERQYKMYKCSLCHLSSNNLAKSMSHMKCHSIDALYSKHIPKKPRAKCTICQLWMPSSRLLHHTKKHEYYARCFTCYAFVKKESIVEHREAHAIDLRCSTCDITFVSEKQLENHKWAHGRLMQRVCGECHLVFNSEVARNAHISLVHRRIDPEFVECNFCKEILVIGIEAHLLEVSCCQARCKLCNMRFKHDNEYRNHVMEHHADLVEPAVQTTDSDSTT